MTAPNLPLRRLCSVPLAAAALFALWFAPPALAQESEEVRQEEYSIARLVAPRFWGGPWLGLELVDLNEPLRAHFGVPEGVGVLVSNVVDDSPAARAGVLVGDILTRLDGNDVTSHRRLSSRLRRLEAGDAATLELWRGGKVETLTATLDERPRPRPMDSYFIFRGHEDLDGDGELDAFVDRERIHEKVQQYFDGDEWRERHEHLQQFLHERRPDMEALEQRLASLKERLEQLEQRLEERREIDEN